MFLDGSVVANPLVVVESVLVPLGRPTNITLDGIGEVFGTDVLVHVALTEETLTTNTDPLTSAHLLLAYEVLGPTVDPGDMLTECWFTDRLVFAEPTLNIVALLSSLEGPQVCSPTPTVWHRIPTIKKCLLSVFPKEPIYA